MMTTKEWIKKPVYIAIIWWTDSALHDYSVTEGNDPQVGLIHGVSAGVVVKVTKDYIALAHDFWESGDYRTIQSIARVNIDKVKYIKL